MDHPEEHALVVKALRDGLGGGVNWDAKAVRLLFDDSDLQGITPKAVRDGLIAYVRAHGGSVVKQKRETREGHRDRYDYVYFTILPFEGFRHGLFIEMRLTDGDDPEFPVVTIVRVHREHKF
jgi:hypothetical protein